MRVVYSHAKYKADVNRLIQQMKLNPQQAHNIALKAFELSVKQLYGDGVIIICEAQPKLAIPLMEDFERLIEEFSNIIISELGPGKQRYIVKNILRKFFSQGKMVVRKEIPGKGTQSGNPNTVWVRTGLTKKSIKEKIFPLKKSGVVLGLLGPERKIQTSDVTYRVRKQRIEAKYRTVFSPVKSRIGDKPKWKPKKWNDFVAGKIKLRKIPKRWRGMVKSEKYVSIKKIKTRKSSFTVKRLHKPHKIVHLIEWGFMNVRAGKRFPGYFYTDRGFKGKEPAIKEMIKTAFTKQIQEYKKKQQVVFQKYERQINSFVKRKLKSL